MKRTWRLKPYVGLERTLVISCLEFEIEKYFDLGEHTFVHFVPGSRLFRHDPQQLEVLQFYVERKLCSQLIFVGAADHQFMESIQSGKALHDLQATIKFDLTKLLKRPHDAILDCDTEMKMLIELNVIHQCKLLMDYFFIKKRVEKNILQVKGVVTEEHTDQLKPIFQNGVAYNDITALN